MKDKIYAMAYKMSECGSNEYQEKKYINIVNKIYALTRKKGTPFFLFVSVIYLCFSVYISDKLSFAIVDNKVYDTYSPKSYFIEEYTNKQKIELKITSQNLTGLHIPFISENDNIKYTVEVIANDQKLSCDTQIRTNADGINFFDIKFYPSITDFKEKILNVSIISSCGISFLYANANKEMTSLEYKQYGFGTKKIQIFLFTVFFIGCILFIFLLYIFLKKGIKPCNLYLILSILFGFINIFVFPPLTQPDAITHYESIYSFSNKILHKSTAEGYILKRHCDLNLLPDYYNDGYAVKNHTWTGSVKSFLLHIMNNYSSSFDTSLVKVPKWITVNPRLEYVPQAIFMTIGRSIGINQFLLYFFVLLGNYTLMVFIIYFTIRYAGDNYIIFFLLGLNPKILIIIQSVSYDAITFSMSLLVASLAYRIFVYDKISKKTIFVSIASSMLLFPMKVVYFPVSLLIPLGLLIKYKNKMEFYKKYAKYISIFLCFSVLLLFFIFYAKYDSGQFTHYSIKYIILHPIKSIMTSFRSFFGKTEWFSFSSSILADVNAPFGILIFLFALMLPLSQKISKSQALIFISVYVLEYLILFLVGLSWTNTGRRIMWGIQERYFYPILPLFLLFIQRFTQNTIIIDKRYGLFIISLCYFSWLLMGIRF